MAGRNSHNVTAGGKRDQEKEDQSARRHGEQLVVSLPATYEGRPGGVRSSPRISVPKAPYEKKRVIGGEVSSRCVVVLVRSHDVRRKLGIQEFIGSVPLECINGSNA